MLYSDFIHNSSRDLDSQANAYLRIYRRIPASHAPADHKQQNKYMYENDIRSDILFEKPGARSQKPEARSQKPGAGSKKPESLRQVHPNRRFETCIDPFGLLAPDSWLLASGSLIL
jgi:hypothetical protein